MCQNGQIGQNGGGSFLFRKVYLRNSDTYDDGMNYQTGERGGAFSPVRALLFNMASSRMTRVDKLSASEKNQRTGRRGEITRRWGICCPKKKGTSSFYFRTVKSALPYGL